MNDHPHYARFALDDRLLIDRSTPNWTTIEYDDLGLYEIGTGGETVERKARAFDVLAEWHAEYHVGRFAWCTEQPCHAVNGAVTIEGTVGLAL